jgi:hypothetical protein
MPLIACRRGTNGTEAFHGKLHNMSGGFRTGARMSYALLAELRHRHNIGCSEMWREGYVHDTPIDTWMVDELQNLYLWNRNARLYANWTNASEYKPTNESFDNIALHSQQLQAAIERQWTKIDKTKVKLSPNERHLADTAGVPLPLLPFTTEEENRLYATCILDPTFPKNDEDAAIKLCEYVDGVKIFPKLAVHIRNHREKFERGQRVRRAEAAAGPGNAMLRQLNAALASSQLSTVQNPAPFPDPKPQALREEEYTTVEGMGVGNIPVTAPAAKVDKRSGRKDKKKRAGRTCKKCRRNRCLANEYCQGRGPTGICQFYVQVSENPVRDEAINCKLCEVYDDSGVSCIGYDKLNNIRVCDKYDDDGTPKQSS